MSLLKSQQLKIRYKPLYTRIVIDVQQRPPWLLTVQCMKAGLRSDSLQYSRCIRVREKLTRDKKRAPRCEIGTQSWWQW